MQNVTKMKTLQQLRQSIKENTQKPLANGKIITIMNL